MSIAIACQDVQFNNIAAVIFDKDGTLENSGAYWRMVGSERARLIDARIPGVGEPLMMAFGIADDTINSQGLMAVGSRTENEIAAAAYIAETGKSWHESLDMARSAFDEVAESKYLIKTPRTAPLYDDVRETLKSLNHRGLKIGILSADSTKATEKFVAEHELDDYVQICVGTDGTVIKPDPQLYLKTCQGLGLPPKQTILVGDSAVDMIMTKAAKAAAAVGICRQQNLVLDSADVLIKSLYEIHAL